MQAAGNDIPFANRVPAAPAAFRSRLYRAALARLDSLILAIGAVNALAPEQRARRRRKGVVAFFFGARSAGKTTAAQVLARETGRDLYIVDLGRVVGRHVGETEKNLDRVLTAAETHDAVLLFDEADALFGRRLGHRHRSRRCAARRGFRTGPRPRRRRLEGC